MHDIEALLGQDMGNRGGHAPIVLRDEDTAGKVQWSLLTCTGFNLDLPAPVANRLHGGRRIDG